eukprot:m.501727 g.501727  ORF g.501727 m.501727 type:complete len:83 (-) comp57333_c0_seq16:100-348(-)
MTTGFEIINKRFLTAEADFQKLHKTTASRHEAVAVLASINAEDVLRRQFDVQPPVSLSIFLRRNRKDEREKSSMDTAFAFPS